MHRFPRLRLPSGVVLCLALAASGAHAQQDGTPGGVAERSAASLDLARRLGVPNAREPIPGLLTSAQPTPDQLAALVDAGHRNVVSLRPPQERGAGWEEAFASDRDVAFTRIPVHGAAGLTREAVEELDRVLRSAGDQPTLLYCASSNRVGALLALRASWIEGAPASEALALGRAAGMRSLEGAVARLLAGG